jgi:hypothetical protein
MSAIALILSLFLILHRRVSDCKTDEELLYLSKEETPRKFLLKCTRGCGIINKPLEG